MQPSPGESTQPTSDDLRTATLAGVRSIALSRVAAEALAFVSTVIVARLVTPGQFGHAALALVAWRIALLIASQGFASPLVQRKDITESERETVAVLSVGAGVAVGATLFVLGPTLLAQVFDDEAGRMFRLISPVFVIAAFGAVPMADLQRALDFRRLGTFEAAGALANAVVAPGLAVAGLNAEAIVLGAIAATTVTTVLALRSTRRPKLRLDRHRALALLRFGAPAAGSSLMYTAFRNVDYLVVGAQLSATQLGIYARSYQLAVDYQGKLSGVMLRIAFPVYSRTPDIAAIRRLRIRIVRTHATFLIPLLAILVGVAPDLVPTVFGEQWRAAVVPTQLLAISGMFVTTMTGNGPLLLAVGRPRVLLAWNAVMASVYTVMVLLVVPLGLTALCVGVNVFFAGAFIGNQLILKRVIGVGYRQTLGDAFPGVAAGAVALVVSVVAREAVDESLPQAIRLVFASVLGVGAGGAVLKVFFPVAWRDVSLILGLFRRPEKTRAA